MDSRVAAYLCGLTALVYLKNKHKKQKRSVSNAALFNAGRRKRPRSYIIVQQFTTFFLQSWLARNEYSAENKLIALPEGVEFTYEPIANSGGLGLTLENL